MNLFFDCTIYKIKQRTIEENLISCSKYGAHISVKPLCETRLCPL